MTGNFDPPPSDDAESPDAPGGILEGFQGIGGPPQAGPSDGHLNERRADGIRTDVDDQQQLLTYFHDGLKEFNQAWSDATPAISDVTLNA